MPEYILEELDEAGIAYSVHNDMDSVIPELDILYDPRAKERFDASEYVHIKSAYVLTAAMLENARDNLKVLHPLPRVDEITTDVDKTPTLTTSSKRATA